MSLGYQYTFNTTVAIVAATNVPIGITIGPVVMGFTLPPFDVDAPLALALGPVASADTAFDINPEREVALGPVASADAAFDINPERDVGLGPVATAVALAMRVTQERVMIGPVGSADALVALTVQQLVGRTLGPVATRVTVIRPVDDVARQRTLGPVLVAVTVNAVNIKQRPPVVRTTVLYPVAFVHSGHWPREQVAVLTSAHGLDRSYTGMAALQTGKQMGQAALSLAVNDASFAGLRRRGYLEHGALLAVESPGLPVWAGPILTIEEDGGSGTIELAALSIEALLDGRATPQREEYRNLGTGVALRALLDAANARNHTGILASLRLENDQPIEELKVGGESVLEALNEMAARYGMEYWVEVARTPRKLDFRLRKGYRQGLDLSGEMHLYEGVHFTGAYKSDLTQIKASVTAIGDFGREVAGRRSVGRFVDAPGIDFGAPVLERGGERTARALRGMPAGLRNERVLFEVMTDSLSELGEVARRAHEAPLGAGEMFNDFVYFGQVDPEALRVGNYYTRHGEHQGLTQVRVVRVLGLQPDEAAGGAQVVTEARV